MEATHADIRLQLGPERIAIADGQQPFLCRTGSGRLVVTAQLPPARESDFPGRWATAVSDDNGDSWQPWSQADIAGGSPFHEGCAAALADGTMLLFEWSARGPRDDGSWLARRWESDDDWRTLRGPFATPIRLPEAKGGVDDMGSPVPELFLHRSLLPLPDGTLLMSAYGWFRGDETPSTYRPAMYKFRSLLLHSDDRGRSWTCRSTIAVDPTVGEEGFNEPVVTRLSHGPRPGRLVALLRTGSNKTFAHNPIYQTTSDDDGASWTLAQAQPFETVDPDLVETRDGLLVATFGYRTALSRAPGSPARIGEGHGNYLAVSTDHGQSWGCVRRLTDGPSSAYTGVREVGPGQLVVVYDIGDFWTREFVGYAGQARAIGSRRVQIVGAAGRSSAP